MIYLACDFGNEVGLGHLFRLIAISGIFTPQEISFIPASFNDKKFLQKLGLSVTDKPPSDADKFVFDGKFFDLDKFQPFEIIKKENRFIVDSKNNFSDFFDTSIFPSFFLNNEDLNEAKKNFSNVLHSKTYFIFRTSSDVFTPSSSICVSFGGSDPNEITARTSKWLKDDAHYLIGPYYNKNNIKKILRYVSNKQLIWNPKTTIKYINYSNIIVTAVGTTLQEVELLNKKCIIISNYEEDKRLFKEIVKSSLNPSNYIFLGKFDEIDFSQITRLIKENTEDTEALNDLQLNQVIEKHNLVARENWRKLLK